METSSICAVLTGDVVASSRRPAIDHGEQAAALAESFATLDQVFDGAFPLPIEISSAGNWQMMTPRPRIALRAAVYYRAELRARMGSLNMDTRVAIGVGPLDPAPRRRVSQGDGPAYSRSARALETLQRTRRLALRLEDQPLSPGFDEMLGLVDHVAGRWTDRQALAVTGALQGWTQERIAEHWDRLADGAVSQQTVAQHLHRAGWHALSPAVDFLEGLLA